MDIFDKIDKLRVNRGWTIYKLAQESGLSQQTIHQWFDNHSTPTIAAIQAVCEAFGITVAEFFSENELIEATDELKKLYNDWCCLTKDEQTSVKLIIENYIKNKQK